MEDENAQLEKQLLSNNNLESALLTQEVIINGTNFDDKSLHH